MSKPDRPSSAGDTAPDIDAGILDRMIEIRRHLHRHPELSNREAGTQRYLREMLASEGIAEIRDVAGYGLAVDIVLTLVSAATMYLAGQENPGA